MITLKTLVKTEWGESKLQWSNYISWQNTHATPTTWTKKAQLFYPGPRGFSFFFFSDERAAKRRARVAKRRERKTPGYLGLESHFHADARVRIWPSGSDWLIFLQTRKSIWLVCLIGKHVIADLPLVCFVIINLTRLTAGVCMKVRFKSKVTRGFSFSPLRDSCSPLRGSLIGKKKEKPLGPGYSCSGQRMNTRSCSWYWKILFNYFYFINNFPDLRYGCARHEYSWIL